MSAPPATISPPERMKETAKRRFEEWAPGYDRSPLNHFLFRPTYVTIMEEIARWYAEHQRRFRILDVGSGTGTMADLLARSSWPVEVVGLDYVACMCAAATTKVNGSKVNGSGERREVRFINGDSEHLPFPDESFDLIACAHSFHHYPNQQDVVLEMSRLLAPGGRLIIIDGFRDCVIGWFVYDVIVEHIEEHVYHAPWPVMHGYFVKAGLTEIRRRHFNFLIPALVTIGDKAGG